MKSNLKFDTRAKIETIAHEYFAAFQIEAGINYSRQDDDDDHHHHHRPCYRHHYILHYFSD